MFDENKKKSKMLAYFLLIFLIFLGLFANIRSASAAACLPNLPPPLTCFGGTILAVLPPIPFVCWVPQYVIGPPKPLVVAVVPGLSQIYRYFSLRPGAQVLGTAVPIPGICYAPIVLKIGTSL